jgi:transcriptional regulator with XRE-family HTH domain
MRIDHRDTTGGGVVQKVTIPATGRRPLHRLAAVRMRQGMSRDTVARRLSIAIEQVQQQESESSDLPLSTVYAWQQVLEVPIAELLVEAGDALSAPVLERSQLVRLMKTALAISEQTKQESVRRMVQTMVGQLVEIMPELAKVSPWPIVGQRRHLRELGVAAQRQLPDKLFIDMED